MRRTYGSAPRKQCAGLRGELDLGLVHTQRPGLGRRRGAVDHRWPSLVNSEGAAFAYHDRMDQTACECGAPTRSMIVNVVGAPHSPTTIVAPYCTQANAAPQRSSLIRRPVPAWSALRAQHSLHTIEWAKRFLCVFARAYPHRRV